MLASGRGQVLGVSDPRSSGGRCTGRGLAGRPASVASLQARRMMLAEILQTGGQSEVDRKPQGPASERFLPLIVS
ncbi:hypothetical protein VFPFJ_02053 [Purpureocillium lilacinum]|uniref:Uncharacterized protein n=1 Tax=Purpureocillium lilacinum TaxID=33203 RepID=A0A179HSQ1_PURLI|nr:hypothetical protein VFPFJ_02053 [Purpureocillium lilacinum]OAQ71820.1 hypothetical protein VFPBJ_10599 [Purpureocillium lilacinum]OAQ92892.1 hypothetical protein VFPFJ_02053 [Purpureocillium lilacinum]